MMYPHYTLTLSGRMAIGLAIIFILAGYLLAQVL